MGTQQLAFEACKDLRRFIYCVTHAGIAQLVERNLAKVDVAGSSPVSRSAPSDRGTGAFGNRAERLL